MAEKNEEIAFSLAQAMMFSAPRTLRALALTNTICVMWEPRLFKKKPVRINLFGLGLGIFDMEAVTLGKQMEKMRRNVRINGFGRFTLYRFGERLAA